MAFVPLRLDSKTSCVSTLDPAIDHDNSAHKNGDREQGLAYSESRLTDPSGWKSSITAKDGQRLTQFVIGVIPPSDLAQIEDECIRESGSRMRELYFKCFLAGVRDIIDGPVDDSGQVPKRSIGGVEFVEPSFLARVFCGANRMVALEIGQNAYFWNQLPDVDVKN